MMEISKSNGDKKDISNIIYILLYVYLLMILKSPENVKAYECLLFQDIQTTFQCVALFERPHQRFNKLLSFVKIPTTAVRKCSYVNPILCKQ